MTRFDSSIVDAASTQREVDLTTFGRRSGKPSRRTIWITTDGPRLYIRSGQGLGRDWPQNLLANGRGILHLDGQDVPVVARHVTETAEARKSWLGVGEKYGADLGPGSAGDQPLTQGEAASFELLPETAPSA